MVHYVVFFGLWRPPASSYSRKLTCLQAVLDEPLLGESGQLPPREPGLHGAQHAAALGGLEVLLQHLHRPGTSWALFGQYSGVKLLIGPKVQCLFCFEMCTAEGTEREGVQIS